jgi:hypothetical protein
VQRNPNRTCFCGDCYFCLEVIANLAFVRSTSILGIVLTVCVPSYQMEKKLEFDKEHKVSETSLDHYLVNRSWSFSSSCVRCSPVSAQVSHVISQITDTAFFQETRKQRQKSGEQTDANAVSIIDHTNQINSLFIRQPSTIDRLRCIVMIMSRSEGHDMGAAHAPIDRQRRRRRCVILLSVLLSMLMCRRLCSID